jgi:hypothetical protein
MDAYVHTYTHFLFYFLAFVLTPNPILFFLCDIHWLSTQRVTLFVGELDTIFYFNIITSGSVHISSIHDIINFNGESKKRDVFVQDPASELAQEILSGLESEVSKRSAASDHVSLKNIAHAQQSIISLRNFIANAKSFAHIDGHEEARKAGISYVDWLELQNIPVPHVRMASVSSHEQILMDLRNIFDREAHEQQVAMKMEEGVKAAEARFVASGASLPAQRRSPSNAVEIPVIDGFENLLETHYTSTSAHYWSYNGPNIPYTPVSPPPTAPIDPIDPIAAPNAHIDIPTDVPTDETPTGSSQSSSPVLFLTLLALIVALFSTF